jgi:hypothetical protein
VETHVHSIYGQIKLGQKMVLEWCLGSSTRVLQDHGWQGWMVEEDRDVLGSRSRFYFWVFICLKLI